MTTPQPKTDARAQSGFTLIELMVTLSVLSILILVAAPAFRDTMMNVRMSANVNDLMSDLALARSEAVKRGVPVRLCRSQGTGTNCSGGGANGDWSVGWIVFVDDNDNQTRNGAELVLRKREAVQTGTTVDLVPADRDLPYRPTGVTNVSATSPTFTLCDGRTTTPHRGRVITVSPTGRPVVTRVTC
jgi:type IV fimbrial biogenesis protein FimT